MAARLQPTSKAFRNQYNNDPAAFVHDCFRWPEGRQPATYQDEILSLVPEKKRVAVRAMHGAGKTALEAWLVIWFALTRDGDDWKCPSTASAWRQLTKYLWPEIHKWTRRLRWDIVGRQPFSARTELLQTALKLTTGESFAVASDQPELIEGAHADRLFYVLDEAKAIPAASWDAIEGAFSNAGDYAGERPVNASEAFALCASTPGDPSGRFYDINARKTGFEDWFVRVITLDEAIRNGRLSVSWINQRRVQWGENSAAFQNRALGNFAASDEDSIIPLAWIEAANERWLDWYEAGKPGELKSLGVDIADGGDDESALAPLFEGDEFDAIEFVKTYQDPFGETMRMVGRVIAFIEARKFGHWKDAQQTQFSTNVKPVIDVIGVGTGVFSRLRELGLRPEGFKASVVRPIARLKDRSGEYGFVNARAAAWWNLRELLDPANFPKLALPPDDELTGDLTAPKWFEASGARIQVEDKAEIRERIGRSTNKGDAVMQACFYRSMKVKGKAY